MRPSPSLSQLGIILLSLSPLVAARVDWPRWLPDIDTLVVRETPSSSSSSNPPEQTASPSVKPTDEGSSSQPISTNLNTASATPSGSGSSGDKPTGTSNGTSHHHTTFNDQDPAGSVVMITPAITDGSQLYKIGDYVTWAWNYTSLQGPPSAVDVLVSCSTASNTWTVTTNMTWATTNVITWDTGAYQKTAVASPLLTEEYTLIIYDAESSISATAEPGYLAPFSGFIFGLYTPRPYTPLGEWQCASCNGALSATEKQALGSVIIACTVTVLSFTWFVTGFAGFL